MLAAELLKLAEGEIDVDGVFPKLGDSRGQYVCTLMK